MFHHATQFFIYSLTEIKSNYDFTAPLAFQSRIILNKQYRRLGSG